MPGFRARRNRETADNGWFWLVSSARKNPRVVLFAGGNALEIMDSKTKGYRDIESVNSFQN